MSTVLYPGSFDPLHNGHLDVVEQASDPLRARSIVATMVNPGKPGGFFDLDERQAMIEEAVAHLPDVGGPGLRGAGRRRGRGPPAPTSS